MDETAKTNLPAISIELGDENSEPFKSIRKIVWHDIPPFALLTGLNGSGKTQLLQVLAYKLSYPAPHPQSRIRITMPLRLTGAEIAPHEMAYLPSAENAFRVGFVNMSNLHQAKRQFLGGVVGQNVMDNIEAQILRERIHQQFGIRIENQQQITPEVIAKLPDDFTYMLEYADVSAGLSHVFFGYQIRRAEKLMEGKSEKEVLAELGQPPWKFVNDALASADFGYQVVPPENKLMKDYAIQVEAADSKIRVSLNDLSSGERVILRTILWFYNTKHNQVYPKLFLMDEPDAHLHPSMTRQFIDVLKNVLVDQYGVRVILSTHSPSTVALAPEDSIFIMSKGYALIRRPTSKAEAIGLLTSGLVIVSPGTRFVLVEDDDDVKFYDAIRDVLADQGPSKDAMVLKPAPSIIFMPASTRKGADKIGGGKNVVAQWVEKFDSAPLDQMFRGVIDQDEGNVGGPRVHVLGRYSIENYQLDPMVIFGVLIEEKKAPSLQGVSLTAGDEHRLRSLPASTLQDVVNYIAKQVEPELGTSADHDKAQIPVSFTNGVVLDYPAWMIVKRGRDLLIVYQKIFGHKIIIPPKLEKSFRRVRLVPLELAEIMGRLQQN